MQKIEYDTLKECLRCEVLGKNKKFSWFKILHRCVKKPGKRFYFWWRIANYMNSQGGRLSVKYARRINYNLCRKYNTDIGLDAIIGKGMKINHAFSIVIRNECVIGDNVILRQNTTIGKTRNGVSAGKTLIGNNVDIGAHSCIIGDITIGDNVIVGAMSFINKDIPSDSTIYTEKTNKVVCITD